MTLKEKIDSIDYTKITKPETIKQFIAKVEEKAKTSMTEAQALMDGVMLKIQEKYPDAIVKKIAPEKAMAVISKLKKLKNIVPRKADFNKIADQIQKQQPYFSRQQAEELAKLRIEAQISRSTSFNDMIDVLSKSDFYAGRLSTANIDKGRTRSLQKDASISSFTEADERKMTGRKFKRISKGGHKNQYGTTKGGNVYYEYRDNRRDVDSKIRLENGGMAEQGRFQTMFSKGGAVSTAELNALINEINEKSGGTFYLSGAYGNYELWGKDKNGGDHRIDVGSRKDIKEALIKNRYNEKFTKYSEGGVTQHGRFTKHFKKGGATQKATYIPKRNIRALTTTYGNTIKGKDLLDGAYTTRKDIRQDPKMIRSIFEEEYFEEFGNGGGVNFKGKLTGIKFNFRNNKLIIGNIIDKQYLEYVPNATKKQDIYQLLYADTLKNYKEASEYLLETRLLKNSELYKNGGAVDSNVFNTIKKGDVIKISFKSAMSEGSVDLLVKSKTRVGKGKPWESEKITFINLANPKGVNFYAYMRNDSSVGFAIGDMAISNVKIISHS
jgi:hypothetical protein